MSGEHSGIIRYWQAALNSTAQFGRCRGAITIAACTPLYSILLLFALVVSAPWWLLEMLRHGKYRAGLGERLGRVPERLLSQAAANTIWIHAVSVGEVLAISRVVDELKAQLPGWRIVVSTTTDTGQKLARAALRREQRFLFSRRSAFCGAGLPAGAASEAAGAGGERILAQPAAWRAALGRGGRGGECARL